MSAHGNGGDVPSAVDVASQGRSLIGFAERSRTPVVFAQFLVVPGVMLTLSDTVP